MIIASLALGVQAAVVVHRFQKESLVECACNCGLLMLHKDVRGRRRFFIAPGHRRSKCSRIIDKEGYMMLRLPNYPRANSAGYVFEILENHAFSSQQTGEINIWKKIKMLLDCICGTIAFRHFLKSNATKFLNMP